MISIAVQLCGLLACTFQHVQTPTKTMSVVLTFIFLQSSLSLTLNLFLLKSALSWNESNVQLYQLLLPMGVSVDLQRSPHEVRPSVWLMLANLSKCQAAKKKKVFKTTGRIWNQLKSFCLNLNSATSCNIFSRQNCVLLWGDVRLAQVRQKTK